MFHAPLASRLRGTIVNNRKAKLLLAKPGQRIRISNRQVVRYAPSGVANLPTHYYGIDKYTSATQNRMKNHS
ncbi:hypothetical protein ZU60_005008, partial [Salmonella enterica subsp. enterica]|nr:hypothetical protein [Salmonella enterica subsp. enterica]